MNRLTRFVPTLLAILLGPAIANAASQQPVTEFELANGLKVLVREDHRAPVVVSQVWYKVGSSYEHGGNTGVSHALEHMMFQGTKRYGPGKFSEIIAAQGGSENAFTGIDYTAYFQTLASDRLEIALELEADRMVNLQIQDEKFAKEIQVVIEERRMRTEDRPTAQLNELFRASTWVSHPYRNPVIGWMSDLDAMTTADLNDWYRRWYMPNNATLVVVGDVDTATVKKLVKKYFGPLKKGQLQPPKERQEVPQTGERRLTVKLPAQLPHLIMGYHVPRFGGEADGAVDSQAITDKPATAATDEAYALDVLTAILDGGSSARFARELQRGQAIAASASAGYRGALRAPGLFTVDGTPAQGHTIAELETALRAQIQRLIDEPVSPAELNRVKTQVVADNVYTRDSVFYQAMQLGMLETVGLPWQMLDEYVDRIKAVTPEQIQQVAKRYLRPDRVTVAILDPQPMDTKKPRRPPPAGLRH